MWSISAKTGLGFSEKAVWSRAARRQAPTTKDDMEEAEDIAFGFKIQVSGEESGTKVLIWWVKGHDSVLFESFCGMVKRKLEE